MDLDDFADNLNAALANLNAYAAQQNDRDLIALVDDAAEQWEALDGFLDYAVIGWLDDETEH